MKLTISNLSSDILSYVNGLVIVSAGDSLEIPSGWWGRLSKDPSFITDLRNSNLIINDGVTSYRYPEAESIVKEATTEELSTEALNSEWGQLFYSCSNTATLTGTSEVPFFYFQNPNGSGKSAKISKIVLGPTHDARYVTYRIYINPTITLSGTPLVEVGSRQTEQFSNVINTFILPTVSSNGSLIQTVMCSGDSGLSSEILYNFSLWVEHNNSLLITRQLTGNTTIGGVTIVWIEK